MDRNWIALKQWHTQRVRPIWTGDCWTVLYQWSENEARWTKLG
jgi:hypothetical protein